MFLKSKQLHLSLHFLEFYGRVFILVDFLKDRHRCEVPSFFFKNPFEPRVFFDIQNILFLVSLMKLDLF